MSDFRKTTVLPQGAPADARQKFHELIHDEPDVLFVVLGEGAAAESLVSKAGKLAGAESEPRWVVWARVLDDIRTEIQVLNASSPAFKDQILAGKALAFTTSFSDEIRDVIGQDEDVDNVRIVQAYNSAEQV